MLDGHGPVCCEVRVFLITPKFRICGTLTLFCPVGAGALSSRKEAVRHEAGALMVWHVSCAYKIYPLYLKTCNFMIYLQCLWFLYQNCSFVLAFSPLESSFVQY